MTQINRAVHHIHWLVAAFALALVCGPSRESRADNESDRKRYLGEIESKLASAASELAGFESDSDAGDLDDARGYVREVDALVDKLDDVKDDDATAREVASRYPRHVSDWSEAAGYLRQLKDRQPLAAGYLRSCKAWDEAMRDRAKASKDDPRAAEDLSAFAKSVGRQGQDLVSESGRARDQLEDAADEVDDFSASDNTWSRLRDATRTAADQIWRRWDRDHAEAMKACEEVVKGERHRDIEAALGRLANSKAGRAELRTKLTAMLGVIADRIDDVESHSSPSNVAGALEVTREVASLLDRLKSAQGDDDEAKKLAADWPAWNDELRSALEGLLVMKQKQRGADAGETKCQEAERVLQTLIATVLATPARHKEGVVEIERAAAQLGNDWRPRLEAAAQGDRELSEGYEKARRFSRAEGPWSAVRDHLHGSADEIRKHWNERYSAAKKACGPLALGVDNPDVKAAIAQLGRDLSSASDKSRAFYAELRSWEAEIGTLRDWTAKDVEDIRAAFCAAPDAGDYDEAIAVADRWASQLRSQYGTITGHAERLKQAADALIAKGRSKDRMEKVKRRIDETLESISKIRSYQLEGSNNPLFKAQTSYGVSKHEELQRGCNAKEITISGDYCTNPNPKRRDCRLDCMKGCTLIEIKPKSQEDLGTDQAEAYVTGLRNMFAAKGAAMFKVTGMEYFQRCVKDGELDLDLDVETYQFCEGMTPDKLVAPVPSVDLPSEGAE